MGIPDLGLGTGSLFLDSWMALSCICPGVRQKQPRIKILHGISEDSHPVCRICFTLLVDVTVEISLFPRQNFDVAVTSMSRFFEYPSEDKLRHHFIELFCCTF